MIKDREKQIINRLSAAVLCIIIVFSQLVGTAPWNGGFAANAENEASPIALRRIDGSGKAFIYHSFAETTEFTPGQTYAFLNGIYDYGDAVSSLGAGAILKATNVTNKSAGYIKFKYGKDAAVKVYVDVITPGKDFDNCIVGGLYKVPNSKIPTEYRYFCGYGGAQNCGPYYAYTYEEESVTSGGVSASLNNIEKQGSEKPEDYTVTITYDGDKIKVLDYGSYTVSFNSPDTVMFVVSDSVGNSITANFQSPLAVRYDGNSENAGSVPSTQAVWKKENSKISSQKPTRSGYSFVNWRDTETNKTYSAGQSFIPEKSMQLSAHWKDIQAPNIGYTPTQVMTGDSDETVKKAVQAALTVTDNEPVSECTVTVTLPTGFTATPGNKNVTVTATDKAGNTASKKCSVYVSSYVDISAPVFTESTKNLTARLNNPGTDAITESGFVWGVMNSPSLTVNNGKAATATAASRAGDKISVTADNLQKGVEYYARAYITAGGVTYYSEEIAIGLGLPAYGTFTIKNNNNSTFTVTRSDGTEGTQTVYYRTVNGSAVGGTHFTHKNGTLTFNAGEKSKTITITEKTANTPYINKPATAYSNADRTYSVEIYRVVGGGSLGSTASAARTMANGSSYTVNRNYYTDYKCFASYTDETTRGDYEDDKLGWYNGKTGSAASRTITVSVSNLNENYWRNTATGLSYYMQVKIKEENAGYQHIQITPGGSINTNFYPYDGEYKGFTNFNDMNPAAYAMTLEHGGAGSANKNYAAYCFPSGAGTTARKPTNEYIKNGFGNSTALVFPVTQDKIAVGYSASGSGGDKWVEKDEYNYLKLLDTQEPQLVSVAPMAGGVYKVGDTFTVSLIFDEIVDSVNSVNIKSVVVNTSWGKASYAGGANTNVLYFKGTVAENASGRLAVNGITNTSYIKDMCNGTTTKATESGTGTTTAAVDTSVPNFIVTANGITSGTGKATVTVNEVKAKTTGMSCAWSDSATAPTNGWVELSSSELTAAKNSGLSLSIRKEPGSGASNGKWYLHVKAVYATTGASTYKNACLDFGTAANPASGSTPPTLTVTADNTNWAESRKISISASGAQTLKYRKSDASSWTTLSKTAASVTVTESGYYTFLLTAGDVTVSKTVQVERIDRVNPTASVGEPTDGSAESPKSGIYTKIVLPITYADAHSGVKTVQYGWTNGTAAPNSWTTLQTGAATVTYTASESAPTVKYLHIKVSDYLNHTCTAYSSPYTVISQTAVDNHTPAITITGAPTVWTNDTATLTWQLSDYVGKNYEVILPDGKTSTESSGQVWARQNGNYTVTVRDLDYGGENSAAVKVDKLDFDPPTAAVSGGSDSWSKDNQTITITAGDGQSGVGKKWYKIVSNNNEIPTEGLTELIGNTITVSDEGEYYVYYKVYDNAGDTVTGREANKTEGFKKIQIDKTAPKISFGDYSAGSGIKVTVNDSKNGAGSSGLASVAYEIENSNEALKTGSVPASGGADVGFTLTELPAGDTRITVTAIDNAGNSSVSCKDIHIDIVSVDITWADMEFTYSDGAWNAAAHTYDGVGWKPDKTNGNKITVRNSGEAAVSVSYRYTQSKNTVSGGFTDGAAAITAPVTLPVGAEKSAWLILKGKPTESMNKAVIGSVTVTIGDD